MLVEVSKAGQDKVVQGEQAAMRVRGFLLDVEGTLVADKRYQPIAGATEFVGRVRQAGRPLRLITNNTTDSKPSLLEKLNRAGFDFSMSELHTCIAAAVAHLRAAGLSKCLVVGTPNLARMFADEGFTVLHDSDVDAVVVGLDPELTYDRLRLACEAVVRHGATLIALHRNRLFVDSQGRSAPSVGPIVEAIAYATQAEPVLIGKPGRVYFQQALDDIGVSADSVLVVSDDPLSDLAGARRMGMRAAFVLSGKYPDQSVLDSITEAERPDFVVETIGDLFAEGNVEI